MNPPSKTEQAIIDGAMAEGKRLDKGQFKIPVELDITSAQVLIATLQLATRHPEFHKLRGVGPIVEHLMSGIVSRIPEECPNIRKLIRMGFDKSFGE